MEKYICDQNNGLGYELPGDYYIPCFVSSPVFPARFLLLAAQSVSAPARSIYAPNTLV